MLKGKGHGGGGGRVTPEMQKEETLKIMLAIWLKEKLHELSKLAGPFIKRESSRTESFEFKALVLKNLRDSCDMVTDEFIASLPNEEKIWVSPLLDLEINSGE